MSLANSQHRELLQSREANCGSEITVIYTTAVATQTALRAANQFAKDLGLTLRLLAIHTVPFHLPLDQPPVSIDFLEQQQIELVMRAAVPPDSLKIKLVLCRDAREYLKEFVAPECLVVVGGRKRRWFNQARRFQQWLGERGYHSIFVSTDARGAGGQDEARQSPVSCAPGGPRR